MGGKALEFIRLMWRGLLLVWQAAPFLTTVAIMLSWLLAFEPLATLWITKQIIDMLTRFSSGGIGRLLTLGALDLASLSTLLATQLAIWVAFKLISSVFHLIQTDAQAKFELSIMTRIMKKCETFDLAFFEIPENIDQLEKSMRGSMMSAWNVIWMVFDVIRTFTQAASLVLVLALLNPLAPVVVALSTLPQIFASSGAARERFKLWKEHNLEGRVVYYFPYLVTDRYHAQEVKFFNFGEYLRKQYEYYFRFNQNQHRKSIWKEQIIDSFWAIVSSVGAILVYVYICVFAFLRRISTGDAVLYMGAVDSFQGSLRGVFHQSVSIYEHLLYLKDLFNLLDMAPEDIPGSLIKVMPPENPPRVMQHGIEFRNVSFKYPNSDKFILHNLSFTLNPKESVAIVGKNGAGKSTLVKLLLRLYDPTEGKVALDGIDLRQYDLNAYREICSAIFQDYASYSLTLRENVGFGDVEHIHDTQRVEEAIVAAGADSIRTRMPKGIDGYLTKNYADDGEELSGGEWQKVALARSLMRNRAQIIILDEPTASLDAFAEYEMFKLFGELTQDKVSILISHRFSTVRLAQKILVLDEGRLVEEGSHEDLLARRGLYAEMYSKQAERYQ